MYTTIYPSFIHRISFEGIVSKHDFDEQHDTGVNWG